MRKPALLLRRLFHDKRGLSAVTVAVSMPVLFGVAGLGVDTGLWYAMKRQNQSAADAAALSAAYEVIGGNTNVATNLTPAASQAATRNNYGGTTPVVTYPYSDAIVASGVKVTLSQTQNAWFSSWFPAFPKFTIANQAVAAVSNLPPACMLALNPTANDTINVAGNPTINAPTCTIVSDSDSSSAFHVQGSATINAATLITPGQISHTGAAYTINLSYPAQTGANFVPDPYASTLTHANFLTNGLSTASPCTSSTVGGITTYTNPGSYKPGCVNAGGLSIKKQHGQPVARYLLADWRSQFAERQRRRAPVHGLHQRRRRCHDRPDGAAGRRYSRHDEFGLQRESQPQRPRRLELLELPVRRHGADPRLERLAGCGPFAQPRHRQRAGEQYRDAERAGLFPSGGRDLPRRTVSHGSAMPRTSHQYIVDAGKSWFRYIGVWKPWPQQAADRQDRLPCPVSAQ